jgi:protein phosphatase
MSIPRLPGPIRVLVAAQTDLGRRRNENEDEFLVADLTVPTGDGGLLIGGSERGERFGSHPITLGPRGILLLVADGMGGGVAGGLASRLAARRIHDQLQGDWAREPGVEPERFASCLQRAVEHANEHLFRNSLDNPELRDMGTTATVAGILDDVLVLAQVGDSRAYLVRDGAAVQLTKDQSLVRAMVEAGAMTEDEAEVSPHRSMILQALGPRADVEVDVTRQELRRGDVVVLCSDGLSSILRKDEISETVAGAQDPAAGCEALVAAANDRGGPDNITVVIAALAGEGLAPPSPLDAVGHIPFRQSD